MNNCPLIEKEFVTHSKSLVSSIRREFLHCSYCSQNPTCSFKSTFHSRIDDAVSDLTSAWALTDAL